AVPRRSATRSSASAAIGWSSAAVPRGAGGSCGRPGRIGGGSARLPIPSNYGTVAYGTPAGYREEVGRRWTPNAREIPTDRSNPSHLAAHVLAAACAEDHSLLDVLLVELTQRLSAHDLVAPTVMGPWVDNGDDHSGRYLASIGGTGPLFALE